MPPSPIPAPLPPWARTLLQLAPLISVGLQEAVQYIKELGSVAAPVPDEWRHLQIIWERTGNTVTADRFVNTIDIVNITNGAVDNSWTDTDYTTVNNAVNAMITAWLTHTPNTVRWVETRWYRRLFNPLDQDAPFAPSGPPERITPGGSIGTGVGSASANQTALTHTEKTPYPRHWGRSYWPCPGSATLLGSGHFVSSVVDSFGAAIENAYQTLQQAEFFPVVPFTQVQGQRARGLLQVTQVQVDDVPDVVRRRRLRSKTHAFLAP